MYFQVYSISVAMLLTTVVSVLLFSFHNNVLNFSVVSISVYLHLVGKLQPHCNKVYKRFAMRENKFMGSNKW
ncbi:hypothetical protein ZEAMMB73_Zm00001d039093 [Zea mays]|uniref:Uncharacterized protein n=1 Tax=Zea mays TaxID=4577 RepID=A0A1D6MDJ0_MAIZE|nr:hypothetical protein ZEAMMB73_Zm00001d039093 [Zea mays]